jgi:hypothetical protein
MTLQFTGTLRYRFRLSIFGYEIFAGPWQSQAIKFSEPIPAQSTTLALADGFTASFNEIGNGASVSLEWEGLPLVTESVPLTGSIPVSVQPLKGVILAGVASVSA